MRIIKVVIPLVITLFAPSTAKAASITLNELALDAIFSQASFGSSPVDIRILPSRALDNAALLNIETSPEMSFLLFLTLSPAPVINAYFVDTISACGSVVDPSIAGCGLVGGNSFVVESVLAAGQLGTSLVAHELGHTLGLSHVSDPSRLMNPFLVFTLLPLLSTSEVATILSSPFVQADLFSGARFVELSPVLITATPVPEPATLLLVATGFGVARLRRRVRHAARRQSR